MNTYQLDIILSAWVPACIHGLHPPLHESYFCYLLQSPIHQPYEWSSPGSLPPTWFGGTQSPLLVILWVCRFATWLTVSHTTSQSRVEVWICTLSLASRAVRERHTASAWELGPQQDGAHTAHQWSLSSDPLVRTLMTIKTRPSYYTALGVAKLDLCTKAKSSLASWLPSNIIAISAHTKNLVKAWVARKGIHATVRSHWLVMNVADDCYCNFWKLLCNSG